MINGRLILPNSGINVIVCSAGIGKSLLWSMVDNTGFMNTVIVCSAGIGKSLLWSMVDNTGFMITVIVCSAGIEKSLLRSKVDIAADVYVLVRINKIHLYTFKINEEWNEVDCDLTNHANTNCQINISTDTRFRSFKEFGTR